MLFDSIFFSFIIDFWKLKKNFVTLQVKVLKVQGFTNFLSNFLFKTQIYFKFIYFLTNLFKYNQEIR